RPSRVTQTPSGWSSPSASTEHFSSPAIWPLLSSRKDSRVQDRDASPRKAITMKSRIALVFATVLALIGASPAHAATQSAADLQQMFTAYGNTGEGWTGADGTYSVPLPDGRTAWLFSDTFLGPVNQ